VGELEPLPFIEEVKLQARVLVPLVKAFEEEFGRDEARSVVRRALARQVEREYRRIRESFSGNPIDLIASGLSFFARDALEYEMVDRSSDAFDFDVTRCAYAEFYHALGEPELGFLLVCELDDARAEGLGTDVQFRRTRTLMQGSDRCDFRYRRR
jgi:hypothetical protein